MKLDIDLPEALIAFKKNIEASIKLFIEIKASQEENLLLWQSKFGGLPYFPKDLEYPKDVKGQPMFLLAQINFAESPKLEKFPETGILQFYIQAGMISTEQSWKIWENRMASGFCISRKFLKMKAS